MTATITQDMEETALAIFATYWRDPFARCDNAGEDGASEYDANERWLTRVLLAIDKLGHLHRRAFNQLFLDPLGELPHWAWCFLRGANPVNGVSWINADDQDAIQFSRAVEALRVATMASSGTAREAIAS